jgi:pSer/pThr/pTyr-binding forkhead associated (FHA) protein
VGWLVCVGGEYFGEGFNLKAGQNFIGRALTMDVPLAKDTSVSRNRHAIVTYDPKGRVFYLQQGESNGLTYRNGELLLAPSKLEPYDKIQVGGSEFVFAAFCGEKFSWEEISK